MTYVPVPKQAPASPAVVPQAVSGVAGTVTLSFGAGVRETSTTLTLNQSCVITVAAAAAGMDQVMTVDLLQGGSGGYVPSFSNVSWGGGIAPAFNTVAGKRDTIELRAVGGDIMGWPVAMSRLPLLSGVPAAPTGVVVTAGVLQASVAAVGVAAFPAVTGYTVYRGVGAGLEGAVPIATNVPLPFIDTGLSAGTVYFYTVAAVNAAGTGPASAEASGSPTAPGALPGAPASISVIAGVGQVTVSAAGVTATPAVTGYTVYRGVAAGSEGATPIAAGVALPFLDTGVSAGTGYYYRVSAVNALGTGLQSPEGQGTPTAPAAAPGAPLGVTATAGVLQVTISAQAVVATPAVTGYSVSRGNVAGGAKSVVASNVAMPFIDGGLSGGSTYFYTVAAVNGVGTGFASSEVSATPTSTVATGGGTAPAHYASFAAADAVLYASPSPAFNPGGATFDMQAFVRMASWAAGGSVETNLWGCWDNNQANRLWRLGLTTDGRIRASWATGASTDVTATSSMAIGAGGGTDLWVRALVVPVTGSVTFSTSVDGVSWVQLGGVVAASGAGAVYAPATLPYLVVGANASASAGPSAEQFSGRFYEARLYVNGVLVTDPQVGAGGVSDSKGFFYAKSSAVTFV